MAGISEFDRRLSIASQAPILAPVPDATISIREYVRCVVEKVEAPLRCDGQAMSQIFEPGRAMTGNAQILITSVLSLNASDPNPAGPFSMRGSIRRIRAIRVSPHPSCIADARRARLRYRLAGPICSPGDVLSWSALLPELAIGDALAIMDAGAYFVPFATSFFLALHRWSMARMYIFYAARRRSRTSLL